MSQIKKLSEEELQSIKSLSENYTSLSANLGETNLKKIALEIDLENINKELQDLKDHYKKLIQKEKDLVQELNDKYGSGSLNLSTGEITLS